ncbi:hypothetical protein ACH4TE_17080 [Streptomyces sioyaensis]|uniref:hypothetical protein n=1 Tax=Streptomyces sioyaensis TaxID=67364 RepID=UPI00379764E8
MSHWKRLLSPLADTTADDRPALNTPSPASGFLTIGGTTYIDPDGSYPLDHRADGSATLIINDTDRQITIVTERNSHHSPAPPADPSVPASAPTPDLVLAPGERTETRRGDSVRVG